MDVRSDLNPERADAPDTIDDDDERANPPRMPRPRSSASVPAARLLVGVIAGVVLCFVAAAAFVQYHERAITGRASLIISNAMPSVQLLSAARGDVHDLDRELVRYPNADEGERVRLRERATMLRNDLEADIASYRALPFFPDERQLFAPVEKQLATVDRDLARLETDPSVVASLRSRLHVLDGAIGRVVTFDAAQGQRLGLEIGRIRGDTRGVAVLLGLASVALAVVAAALALRQLRRASRVEQRDRELARQHTAELAARAEALGQFAGRVAHDILSPLATTSLSLEVVNAKCEDNPQLRRAAERGVAALQRVRTLVDDLLAFSRAGGRPTADASTHVIPVIEGVLDGLAEDARRERIALAFERATDVEVACAPGVLTSMVGNLVRNGIRHMGDTEDRRISLRMLDLGDRLRVEVEDTGPGIPVEHQQRIFEPYVQLGTSSIGLGLGLATVNRLVRTHGGKIGVISPSHGGCGARFWFELPKAKRAAPALVLTPQEST